MVTGVQFREAGLQPVLVAAGEALLHPADHAVSGKANLAVPVWDTESRADAPADAYRKVRAAAMELRRAGATLLFKQADSQLRGNLGAELAATLDAWEAAAAVVALANPDIGRLTVGGYHLADGRLVHLGPAGVDPITPVRESFLPALLVRQLGRAVEHLDLAAVQAGAEGLAQRIAAVVQAGRNGARGAAIMVADVATDADLRTLASAVRSARVPVVCGSYGLARALAQQLGPAVAHEPRPKVGHAGRVLVVAGSATERVRAQVCHAGTTPSVTIVPFDAARALGDARGEPDPTTVGRLIEILEGGKDAILISVPEDDSVERTLREGARLGLSAAQVAQRVSAALGKAAAGVVTALPPGRLNGLILTGGDTAFAALRALHEAIDLLCEVMPGAALGVLRRSGLPFVAKSGACGPVDAFVAIIDFLRARNMGTRDAEGGAR